MADRAEPPRIAHIALKVADLEQAAAFYERVFGFWRTDTRTERGRISCHLTDGTVDLAMVQFIDESLPVANAAGVDPCIHHFGIDVDDVDAFTERLTESGAEILDDGGSKTVKFRVPGGGGIAEIAPFGWHARSTSGDTGPD